MYVWEQVSRGVYAAGETWYLCAVGVERGLCVVCFYRLGIELQSLVPLLVPEGIVALILELGRFVGRGTHDVSMRCGTNWGMRGTRVWLQKARRVAAPVD
jgi:hypothetical protein